MKTCYIAGPYAGTITDDRVVWLARLALAMGMAPVVVHPAIRAGAYGDDAAKAIAEGCNEAWCLHHDDGTMSDGCRYELLHRRHRGGTWADWQTIARVLHPDLLSQVCAAAPEPAEAEPRKVAPPWTWSADLSLWERGDLACASSLAWDAWTSDKRQLGGIAPPGGAGAREMRAAADAVLRKDGWVLPEDEVAEPERG